MSSRLKALDCLNGLFILGSIDLDNYTVKVQRLAVGLSIHDQVRISNAAFITL